MRVYLGVLGDPAKLELYADEFYDILDWDESQSVVYLLGASEKDVTKEAYREMYHHISQHTKRKNGYSPIPGLTEGLSNLFSSRIGLFPSSATHLIKGPEFTFAPYPINTERLWLKIKSRFLATLINPFVPHKIIPLAYHPLGGKAATRAEADTEMSEEKIVRRFLRARKSRYLKWHYLEGGSGEKFMGGSTIRRIMRRIHEKERTDGERIIGRMIYGGGIVRKDQVDEILFHRDADAIPQMIVVGNISERNVKTTYQILERIMEFNE